MTANMAFDIEAIARTAHLRAMKADAGMIEIKPMQKPFSQRFDENFNNLLGAIRMHVMGTLDPKYHYVANGSQTIDTWDSRGSLSTTALDTATKYLDRYGKKEGKNPKDLLKAIHYILMAYQKDIVEANDSQRKDP